LQILANYEVLLKPEGFILLGGWIG
jgi:hypothetical protein